MLNPNLAAQRENEPDLLARVRRREADAFRLVMQKYNRRLFRIARSIVREDAEAEDVVQETYLSAFLHLGSFEGKSSFGTWLTRIAMNEALGRLRRRKGFVDLSELEATPNQAQIIQFPLTPPIMNPERSAMQTEVRKLLEQAIDGLPPSFRTVFIARDVEGLNIGETAELLGVKPETVKTRLHRARQLLRKALDKELTVSLAETFAFDGERCARLSARVMQRLGF